MQCIAVQKHFKLKSQDKIREISDIRVLKVDIIVIKEKMYQFIAYPLDVVKTNRIIGTQLSREAGENLPREMVSLYERGALQTGMYRGLSIGLLLGASYKLINDQPLLQANPYISLTLATVLTNPLLNLQTMKQLVKGPQPASYSQLAKESGVKLLTRGITAHLGRNLVLASALAPAYMRTENQLSSMIFGFGALMASHPLEVARVLIVNNEASHITGRTFATLQTLYSSEGIAGLYRGFIPRAIHLLPVIMAVQWNVNCQKGHDMFQTFEIPQRHLQ